MQESIPEYGLVIVVLLVLATLCSWWRFVRLRRRAGGSIFRKPVKIRPARVKVLDMEPLSLVWNQQRVMKLRLLVFPEMGAAFMMEVQVIRAGEQLEPIHESRVLMLEYAPDESEGRVWLSQ